MGTTLVVGGHVTLLVWAIGRDEEPATGPCDLCVLGAVLVVIQT